MKIYNRTERELEEEATQVKNLTLQFLHREGIISDSELEKYAFRFAVILRKPSFFNLFFKNKDKNELTYYFVKRINHEKEDK